MARRRQRYFGDVEKQALLQAIGECRAACIKAQTAAPINEPIYRATDVLMDAIDSLAEVLTGDREHFHLKSPPGIG